MKTFKELRESFLTEGYSKNLSDREIDAQFKKFSKPEEFFGDLDKARAEMKQDYSPSNSARPKAWNSLSYPVRDGDYYFAFISKNEKKNMKFNDQMNDMLKNALREINKQNKAVRAPEVRDLLWDKASEMVSKLPRDLGAGDTMTREEIWMSIGHMLGMNEDVKEMRDAMKTRAGIKVGRRAKAPKYEANGIKEGKLGDEIIRRHFANVWAMSAKEPKILDMFHKAVDTANFNKKKKAYSKMPIGPFIRDELGGGYLDPRIIKKLNLKSESSFRESNNFLDLRVKLDGLKEANFEFVDLDKDSTDTVKQLAKKYGLKVKEKKTRTGINIDLEGPNSKMGNFMQNLPADALEGVNEALTSRYVAGEKLWKSTGGNGDYPDLGIVNYDPTKKFHSVGKPVVVHAMRDGFHEDFIFYSDGKYVLVVSGHKQVADARGSSDEAMMYMVDAGKGFNPAQLKAFAMKNAKAYMDRVLRVSDKVRDFSKEDEGSDTAPKSIKRMPFKESVNEDRELQMITRKHKRELQKAQRTGNLELSDKAEEDLVNWAMDNGDIRGDDPDEFIEWLDDNLDQLVKGTGRL